jgi:flagellar protein FliJ
VPKKSQRIKIIVDIKANQEKKFLEILGIAQRKLLTMQAQIEGLRKYRQEYQDKFNQRGGEGIGVMQIMEFRSFMDKLDKAIVGQELSVDECQTDVNIKRKIWEGARHKTQSLQKVCNSALAAELKQQDKFEQLEQDERASRLGGNSSTTMGASGF